MTCRAWGSRHPIRIAQHVLCLSFLCWCVLHVGSCDAFQYPVRLHPLKRTTATTTNLQYIEVEHLGYKRCIGRHMAKGRTGMYEWDGDDLRWWTKFRRRLIRRSSRGDATLVRTTLMVVNILLFLYQTVTTVNFLRQRHPEYWPSHAASILADTIVGSSLPGPLIRDFGFSKYLATTQPHRYLTSGFFHGGIMHLIINLDTWRRQPAWLETGLGAPLYLTTFLISVVAGNVGQARGAINPLDQSLCLGSSGGICGLYGLMFASLIRMGNREATRRIFRGMATMTIASLFLESVSTLSHLGGFLAGVLMAILFSPSYKKNYSMRRKNSTEYDPAPRDFRQAMGFGIMATERGMLPVSLLWGVLACSFAFAGSKFHAMPALVIKGFLFPGSLTS